MLLYRKGKLTIAMSKSSRLSYNEVVSLSSASKLSKISMKQIFRFCCVLYFEFIEIYLVDITVEIMIIDG